MNKILTEIISKIVIPAEFGPRDDEDFELPPIFYEVLSKYDVEWDWRNGASKLVLVFPEFGVALKIPFNGFFERYNETPEFSECADCEVSRCCRNNCPFSIEWETNEGFSEFSGADVEDNWNYCKVEAEYYQIAKDAGCEKFFARTEFLGLTANNYPVYIQELCIPSDECGDDVEKKYNSCSQHSKTKAKEIREQTRDYFGRYWSTLAVEVYGEELFETFLKYFAKEHSEMFGDMHSGNYGYRADGTPVIFDFSDYMG